jgi:hypothetical protein
MQMNEEDPMADADGFGSFTELMAIRGSVPPAPGEVAITGRDPFFKTPFRIGETVAAVLAASGVAANDLWELRTGHRQRVGIDVRDAAAGLHVINYTRKLDADGNHSALPTSASMQHMASVTQHWPTADGGWFLPHFNLPHLERRVLDVLDCESTPVAVEQAVGRWNADDLETAIANARACGARSAVGKNGWRIRRVPTSRRGLLWRSRRLLTVSPKPFRPVAGRCQAYVFSI